MSWPAHPDDELIEVTKFGDTEPTYVRGASHIAREVMKAAALYISGAIPFEEFERRMEAAVEPHRRSR